MAPVTTINICEASEAQTANLRKSDLSDVFTRSGFQSKIEESEQFALSNTYTKARWNNPVPERFDLTNREDASCQTSSSSALN
jgi:hypothetical protein